MLENLNQAFNECVGLVGRGASIDECLARYPDHADELAPMLSALGDGDKTPGSSLPPGARDRIRRRVMAEWDRRYGTGKGRRRVVALLPRWAVAAAVMVVVLAAGGAGVSAASQDSTPGAPLYPVKQFQEEARVWMASSPDTKISVYSSLVHERVNEIRKLAARQDPHSASIAISRLEDHLSKLDGIVAESSESEKLALESAQLLEGLKQAITQHQDVESTIQDTISTSAPRQYPCLERSLEVIQTGRERVRQALAAFDFELPQTQQPGASGLSLCSP